MVKKEDDKPEITAETVLASEFASDTPLRSKGLKDMRRNSKIGELEKAWLSFFKGMFPPEEGGEYFDDFCENWLNLSVSVDGWHNNKKIQFVAGSKGAPAGVGELVKKPGILQRNITNRDWKKKADEQGQTVVE